MKIIAINTFNIGSTGKIMLQIADKARAEGIEYYTACPRARDNYRKKVNKQIFIGNRLMRNIHGVLSKITGLEGCFSILSTLNFLIKLNKINPDIIHLHNIHGSYINFPLLFFYVKRKDIKVVWTLHDCWSFTGRCPHFIRVKCEKWKKQCCGCIYPKKEYPTSLIDTTRICYEIKKYFFSNVHDMIIVTPSKWLANLVKKSFLNNYPVQVINNGIDLKVFKPCKSDFRERHHINESDIMLLGVAFDWSYVKGLDVFVELAELLDNHYKIVLVGTNDNTEKQLPNSIIPIRRTENQKQLAEIYSAADIFINPTREENYPTVNMESIACGTPVISFETGGSPEIIADGCGNAVPVDDIEMLVESIKNIKRQDKALNSSKCVESGKSFENCKRINEYIAMYKSFSSNNYDSMMRDEQIVID